MEPARAIYYAGFNLNVNGIVGVTIWRAFIGEKWVTLSHQDPLWDKWNISVNKYGLWFALQMSDNKLRVLHLQQLDLTFWCVFSYMFKAPAQ